ncbi:MAG: hypothetical protein LBN29_14335 [Mediterranea sp.]|nr:hypothetical protein [Mediterranea sp.]
MKKSIFYLMCATVLLGLGACGEDIAAPGTDNPVPSVPVPDAEGMVAVYLNANDGGYKDGVPEATRANGGEAIRFTHDLGDGFIMESELVPSPATRAGEEPLVDGVMVIAVTYDNSQAPANADVGYPVLGYELTSVQSGKLLIHLKETGTSNLVLVSENGTSASDLLKYVTGATNTTTGKYHELATTFPSSIIPVSYLAGDGNQTGLPTDVLISKLEGVTASSFEGDNPPAIGFLHLFSELTWEVEVSSIYTDIQVSQQLHDLSVGLYPRHGTANDPAVGLYIGRLSTATFDGTTLPSVFVSSGAGTWSTASPAGTATNPNILFYREGTTGVGLEYTSTVRFVPVPSTLDGGAADYASGFYINSMVFHFPSKYDDLTTANRTMPIYTGASGAQSLSFRTGYTYTIKSKIAKRPVEFAISNIYWDSVNQRLTFDTTETNPATNWAKQGVLFKWGSLVGISPAQQPLNSNDWSDEVTVYVPPVNSASWYAGRADGASYHTGNNSYTDIPCMVPNVIDEYFLTDPANNTPATYAAYQGDICQYLGQIGAAAQGYRIPTIREFALGRMWKSVTGTNSEDNGAGTEDGQASLALYEYVTNGTNSLPSSGRRLDGTNIIGKLDDVGNRRAYYWAADARTVGFGTAIVASELTDASSLDASGMAPSWAFPIRCVKTLTE